MIGILRTQRILPRRAAEPDGGDEPMPLTATDGRTHLIGAGDLERALTAGTGTYRALCRQTVLAASLATPPGPACPGCHTTTGPGTDHRTNPRPRTAPVGR